MTEEMSSTAPKPGNGLNTIASIAKFVGPAQQTFDNFNDLCVYSLGQYWKDWRTSQSYCIPPIFQFKKSDKSDEDFEKQKKEKNEQREAKKMRTAPAADAMAQNAVDPVPNGLTDKAVAGPGANQKPPKATDDGRLVIDRSSDIAEHLIFDSIVGLMDQKLLAPFIAIQHCSVKGLKGKSKLLQLFPNISLDQFDCLDFEYDFVLIGPQIGIIVIEVKSSQFMGRQDFRPKHKQLPEQYKHGIDQLNTFDSFLQFLVTCARSALPDSAVSWPQTWPVSKILFTPNLTKTRVDEWLGTLDERSREHLEQNVFAGINRLFGEDKKELDQRLKDIISTASPISTDIYHRLLPVVVGLVSFAVFESTETLDRSKLSSLVAAMDDSERVCTQDALRELPKAIEKLKLPSDQRPKHEFKLGDRIVKKIFKYVILTPEQRAALDGPPVQCLIGVAGTGKTIVLQAKALEILAAGGSVHVLTTDTYRAKYVEFFESHGCTPPNAQVSTWDEMKTAASFMVYCLTPGDPKGLEKHREEKRYLTGLSSFIETRVDRESYRIIGAATSSPEKEAQLILSFLKNNDSILIDDAFDSYAMYARLDKGPVVTMLAMARLLRPTKTLWIAFDPYAEFTKKTHGTSRLFFLEEDGCGIGVAFFRRVMRTSEKIFQRYYRQWITKKKLICSYSLAAPSLGHKILGADISAVDYGLLDRLDAKSAIEILWTRIVQELDELRSRQFDFSQLGIILLEKDKRDVHKEISIRYKKYLEDTRSTSQVEMSANTHIHYHMDVSSLEWPIVLVATFATASLEDDVRDGYRLYRACSRATGKLILMKFFYRGTGRGKE